MKNKNYSSVNGLCKGEMQVIKKALKKEPLTNLNFQLLFN